ncbi:hypothetical protein RhiJN_09893 [Ceratobasidium sp. AG-Ba]|nr:hypothetical protein RhiJN_09893 [Ceratobasidium sp. AG-Ba]QRW10650.1 hypothetical protein RhiLY_09649 [Ceratobasidium sp. AG-Ba]
MPDVYSGWTVSIADLDRWRGSAHCPDKFKNRPHTPGDVSALHAVLNGFLNDLGVLKYVFAEIVHRPIDSEGSGPEPGERVIIFARRHNEDVAPLVENEFDRTVKTYLDRAGFEGLSAWQNILWDGNGVAFI